jgi:excisionase family DNA binding protein
MNTKEKNIPDNSEFLTPEEVAQILKVNVLTVYNYIRQNNLNAVRLGRNYRIGREDFFEFIDSRRTKKMTGRVTR